MSSHPGKPSAAVVVAVLAGSVAGLEETITRIRSQVYGTERIVIVGAAADGRHVADREKVEWIATVPKLLASVDGAITHFWFVHAGALPRPDALGALIEEMERAGASVGGSKLVDRHDDERLLAVGTATDVFGVPYLGLDIDERDAGQYDVVRDVAAVSGVSMLIRRDLANGVGGPDPLMAPEAAAIDLCQRARLRGARIVVVPSSEVLCEPDMMRASSWREDAGRIRSMLKSYSWLTLVWAIPLRFLVGLIEAIVSPLLGKWTAFGFVRAWAWNVLHLPSTMRARSATRRGRAMGDAELFRYQMRGSLALSNMMRDVAGRLRSRLEREEGLNLSNIGSDLRQPAFIVGALTVLVSVVAVRAIGSAGWPGVGFSLPLPESGRAAIRAYAGGWNPGGFGSVEPLRPLIGFTGLVQVVLFDSPKLTAWALSLAGIVGGIWGMIRLLRSWQIEVVAGWAAGLVLVAGPATRTIGSESGIGTLLAVGALPWALRVAVAPWPGGWRRRVGRLAAAGWVTGLLAVLAPPLLVAPVAILLVRAILAPRHAAPWKSLGIALVGALVAVPLLLPWLGAVDLRGYLEAGSVFWEPGLVLLGALAVAFVVAVLVAPRLLVEAAILGGVIAAGGAWLARADAIGAGREAELAGLALVGLGSAFVVGSSLEAIRRVVEVTGWRRLLAGVGAAGALIVVASTLLTVVGGRGNLPGDRFTEPLRFTAAADNLPGSSRILLIGPEASLPGESRRVRGAAYRVVSAPIPRLWEADLPGVRSVDQALEATLLDLISGTESRAGKALAGFGIRWVVALGDSPLEAVFDGQLDLVHLGGAKRPTFLVEAELPVRAVTTTGAVWQRSGTGYVGDPEPGERVFLAESANSRWGPGPWRQIAWGNEVAADQGVATFDPVPERRAQAMLAGALLLFLIGVSAVGRRRRR